MADSDKRIRETTNKGKKRRNARFPNSSVWSEDRRLQHRDERDSVIEEVGLATDRSLNDRDGEPDGDAEPGTKAHEGD